MIIAPVQHNWNVDRSPWSPIFGALTGKGDGLLAQVFNSLGGSGGDGSGGNGLLGLIMNGRANRDSAKVKYDKNMTANLKNARGDIGLLDQYRKADGTFDIDALQNNSDALSKLANGGVYNPTQDTLSNIYKNANSYVDKFGAHDQMNYAANHKWKDYENYQAYDPNTFYGETQQPNESQQGILPTQSMQATYSGVMGNPIIDTSGEQGNWKVGTGFDASGMLQGQGSDNQTQGNWKVGTGYQPDAAQLMQAATTMDNADLPQRTSQLSQQSQEAGQQATNDAVKAGMEAANKGSGLLGSAIKGAIRGVATGGSALGGALNGAKNWGIGQMGSAGQLYGMYQGISNNGADTNTATQQPVDTWRTYALTQPTGYQMGNYGQNFMRNNGYGGLI